MTDFTKHSDVKILLRDAQEAETDRRETVREVHSFLHDDNGQWEETIWNTFSGRPRYTFDRCNDIVDDIAGEMEQADFDIRVKPSGGDATKDIAKVYDGLIRNIETLSNASDIYSAAGRSMVAAGMDGWRITQRWGDNDTFDQDLYIDPISDFVDTVWFDPASKLPTREDAKYCFVLEPMAKDDYEKQFPKGSGQSIDSDNSESTELTKPDFVTVGEFIYKTKTKMRIVEMINGAVYKDDEKYQMIKDELEQRGITEKRDRMRELDVVKTRIFDGGGWLMEPQTTVFDYLPIVPTYGNFSISQKKAVYWGVITKKMDTQRVYNYTESRKVEEGALAPLEKIVATDDQIGAHAASWTKLNTSADPVLRYVHMEGQPPPFKIGGAQINPGLETVSLNAKENLQSTAGIDQLNDRPVGLQSGVAVELQQNKGDTRNYKYSASQERAICHTAKILIRAIPKVYDSKRQVRVLNEDASFDMVTLNEPMFNEETKEQVTLNDLSQGLYDVTCDVGPAFKNRQTETVQAFNEVAALDPSILEMGKDIWFNNMTVPGMDLMAERARMQMLSAGLIPEEQMTDEEKEAIANAPEPEPDPIQVALEGEVQNESDRIELLGIAEVRKERELDLKEAKEQRDANEASMKESMEMIQAAADELKTQAETLKLIREGLGLETITGPDGIQVFKEQARQIQESQAEQL